MRFVYLLLYYYENEMLFRTFGKKEQSAFPKKLFGCKKNLHIHRFRLLSDPRSIDLFAILKKNLDRTLFYYI